MNTLRTSTAGSGIDEIDEALSTGDARATGTPKAAFAWAGRFALLIIWLMLAGCFAILVPDEFLQAITFNTIFGTQSVLVFLTLALLLPLSMGDFDMSVANTMGMSATLMVVINGDKLNLPLGLALVAALGAGALIGAVNGLLVVRLGVDSIVATLGMGTLLLGLANWISGSIIQTGISASLTSAVTGNVAGLPLSFWYGIVLAALLWYLATFRPIGRRVAFVGQSRDVARLSGVRVDRLRFLGFVSAGSLAALAGIMQSGQLGAFQASSATSFLLPTFAAAFLGTTAVIPGQFNPWGSVIAIYFLVTGITGLNLLGLTGWIQDAFYGAALIIAVTLSTVVRKNRPA